jgi:hypothetical protein
LAFYAGGLIWNEENVHAIASLTASVSEDKFWKMSRSLNMHCTLEGRKAPLPVVFMKYGSRFCHHLTGTNNKELFKWKESVMNLRRPLGHAVAYLVEALCYKAEGRRFSSQCHRIFQLT